MERSRQEHRRRAALVSLSIVVVTGVTILTLSFRTSWPYERELVLARGTGILGLGLLLLTLLITPCSRALPRASQGRLHPYLAAQRRALGMSAAWVSLAHAIISHVGVLRADLSSFGTSTQLRAGAISLAILLVLLGTSFPKVVSRLRIGLWKELRRLAYAAVLFSLAHALTSPFASRTLVLETLLACGAACLLRLRPLP